MNKQIEITEEFLEFVRKSPSPFHVVDNMKKELDDNGFIALDERKRFNLEKGRSYYVSRNNTALIAFRVPEGDFDAMSILSAHTDSPTFKLKSNPEITSSGLYTTLNVEKYGGMLMAPWFDRPLSIAGRAFVENDNGDVEEVLVDFDEDLVEIVNLAIHMNRDANNGHSYKVQKELLPIFAEGIEKGRFMSYLAKLLGVAEEKVVDYDLFLYNRMPGSVWGFEKRFFSSPKIDDLGCAWSALKSLEHTKKADTLSMIALFDNEETGSGTKQGALSDFLPKVIERIFAGFNIDEEKRQMIEASSYMLSADNGHAAHPNYMEVTDPANKPRMNGGIILKYSANQKYTTDGESGALVRSLCRKNDIPLQVFVNNSDIQGGSTLGNLSAQKISLKTADVGISQLAMHSPYETAGVDDTYHLIRLFDAFLAR